MPSSILPENIHADVPPAYEISQQAFDDKTARAVLVSASSPPPRRYDDDGFEIWDEAIYRAHTDARKHHTPDRKLERASHEQHIEPAQTPESVSSSSQPSIEATPPQTSRSARRLLSRRTQRSLLRMIEQADEDVVVPPLPSRFPRDIRISCGGPPLTPTAPDRALSPPPVFTPVGPSLDGPDYDEVVFGLRKPVDRARPLPARSRDTIFDANSSVGSSSIYSTNSSHRRTNSGQS